MNTKRYKEWLYYNNDESRPLNKNVYQIYFNEGRKAFLDCLDPNKEENPHSEDGNDLFYKAYPWFDGYRAASEDYFYSKYKLEEFQNKVRTLIKEYGLKLKYSDEYHDPYAETPEGFIIKLA